MLCRLFGDLSRVWLLCRPFGDLRGIWLCYVGPFGDLSRVWLCYVGILVTITMFGYVIMALW